METLTPASTCGHARIHITTRHPTDFINLTDFQALLEAAAPGDGRHHISVLFGEAGQ